MNKQSYTYYILQSREMAAAQKLSDLYDILIPYSHSILNSNIKQKIDSMLNGEKTFFFLNFHLKIFNFSTS